MFVISNFINSKFNNWQKSRIKEIAVFEDFIKSIQNLDNINAAKLVVAIKQGSILAN